MNEGGRGAGVSKSDGTTTSTQTPEGGPPRLRALAEAIGAPGFVVPWLDRFYDEDDVDLVLAVASGGGFATSAERLERTYRRAVLDRDEAGAYAPADLHTRLEFWAMFEGWKDVPLTVHRRLADWDVDHYAEKIRAGVEAVRDGREGDRGDYTYVMLDEAEAIVRAQKHVYLWPCDCRSIVSRCRKPLDVCLRFDNDRGVGWEISAERAVAVLRATDKAGLMHTADYAGDPSVAGAICNCCTDCCYPHLATERLGTAGVWPVRRHVASIDPEACTQCGRCALRCPFGAVIVGHDGRPDITAEDCRGCGLCETGCSADAIRLVRAGEG
jgi:Pyruvate/2-oxoacid:ferredoxin oxidoreductase delta subunit